MALEKLLHKLQKLFNRTQREMHSVEHLDNNKAIQYASFDRRLLAATIDFLIIAFISIPFSLVLGYMFFGSNGPTGVMQAALESYTLQLKNNSIPSSSVWQHITVMASAFKEQGVFYRYLLYQLSSFILIYCYIVLSWFYFGATIGKQILGVKIIRIDGSKMSFSRCNLRFLAYFISLLVFFIGFVWIYWNKQRRGWHDYIAGTVVIRTRI